MRPTSDEYPAYMPQLDGLRGIAVLMVIYSHWFPQRLQARVNWGQVGVQLFFVLSGFLITRILLAARKSGRGIVDAAWVFYARRFLRIFPLYYMVIFVASMASVDSVSQYFWWHTLYLTNHCVFERQEWIGEANPFWTLAVEEQFYLIWPMAILLAKEARLWRVILCAVGLGVATRVAAPLVWPSVKMVNILVVANLDALGFGGVLAFWGRRDAQVEKLSVALGTPLILISQLIFWLGVRVPEKFYMPNHGLADLANHFGIVLLSGWFVSRAGIGFDGRFGQVLKLGPLVFIGRISYGLYVLHQFAAPFIDLLLKRIGFTVPTGVLGDLLILLAKAILTMVAATVSWRFFERPLNDLKRKFTYARQPECEQGR